MIREASLQRLLRKLKQKNVYDKLYPFGSAPARICGTPKMDKFFSNTFPKLRPIVSSIGNFNYGLAHFLCDLLLPVVPDDYLSLKLRMQIFLVDFLFPTIKLVFLLTLYFKKPST